MVQEKETVMQAPWVGACLVIWGVVKRQRRGSLAGESEELFKLARLKRCHVLITNRGRRKKGHCLGGSYRNAGRS